MLAVRVSWLHMVDLVEYTNQGLFLPSPLFLLLLKHEMIPMFQTKMSRPVLLLAWVELFAYGKMLQNCSASAFVTFLR
jgi:hypothetical protein